MTVVERKKNIIREKKFLILFFVIILAIVVICLPTIQSMFNKVAVAKTKEETTITKTLSQDKLYQLERSQRDLANEYLEDKKTKWLGDEILDAALDIGFNTDFITDNPQYDTVKILFPVTKYKDGGNTIEFISDKGKIIEVHSKDGWSKY